MRTIPCSFVEKSLLSYNCLVAAARAHQVHRKDMLLQVGKTSHMLSRCKYIYSSGLLAKVGSGRRAADVPGHRDLSPAPLAQPEALVHCSCLVGEKSWKPQIRITTDR